MVSLHENKRWIKDKKKDLTTNQDGNNNDLACQVKVILVVPCDVGNN